MKQRLFRSLVALILCISLVIPVLPQSASAGYGWSYSWTEYTNYSNSVAGSGSKSSGSIYQYDQASNIDELIEICKKYSDRNTVTGVRNQIDWMNQLYSAVVQDFVGQLGLGETLLLAVLNHTDINTTLMTSSYSTGDINREVAKKMAEGADGYADVDDIAKATGLKAKDVLSILERIAAGGITEKTIAVGKNRSRASSRGVYVNHQAIKQDKVWKYLVAEVERMTKDPDSLTVLYQDLGTGYVENMLSGQELDKYMVSLYKKHLAKTLDKAVGSENPINISTITKADPYNITKKTQSALSKLYKYEMAAAENNLDESLSEELTKFLQKHKGNGIFTESEAREYLILSGQYEEGERGIGEASKLLSNSYKHMKDFEAAMKTSGKVFSAVEKAKKVQEFVDYLVEDYGKQEILLDNLVETLSVTGADMELMAAAKELKQDYESKLSGTLDKMYSDLINKGIGTVKSAFPPLGIAEACISLTGTITGADDKAGALETGFAMQGICKQAIEDYENAVIAINKGDTGDKAVARVISTFETARQSLVSYYEAMITLADTKEQKNLYSTELQKLKNAELGYVTVSLPFGVGSAGSR